MRQISEFTVFQALLDKKGRVLVADVAGHLADCITCNDAYKKEKHDGKWYFVRV